VLVLSFAASSAGSIMRDVLIGSVPPAAIGDWRYLIAALFAGLLIFIWFPRYLQSSKVQHLILIFDAAGLGLFAVTGTQKALGYGLNPIMAPLLGMLSGIGGGMLRDVLVAEIPNVLRSDLYAVASPGGCGRGCDWGPVGHSPCRGGDCGRRDLLLPSPIGDPSRLATA
jgi:uncharacterized membrane protein YeiH